MWFCCGLAFRLVPTMQCLLRLPYIGLAKTRRAFGALARREGGHATASLSTLASPRATRLSICNMHVDRSVRTRRLSWLVTRPRRPHPLKCYLAFLHLAKTRLGGPITRAQLELPRTARITRRADATDGPAWFFTAGRTSASVQNLEMRRVQALFATITETIRIHGEDGKWRATRDAMQIG